MPLRRFSLLFAATTLLALTSTTSAYTLKTSETGAPVHWTDAEVAFVPALEPGPASMTTAAAKAAIEAAATTWRSALAASEVSVVEAQTTATAAPHGNDGINTVRWALGADDPDIERGVLALTFVAYRTSDGVIEDADIVLNAASFTWTTTAARCQTNYDLESALTHELGHALGLAHSEGHPEATMFATGGACEVIKRDLASDDQAGIAALYPVVAASDDEAYGGCSASRPGGATGLAMAVAALVLVRKRRASLAVPRRGGTPPRPARWPAVAAAVLAALGTVAPADASQLRRLELADLGRGAVLVVRGHVVAVTVAGSGAIETDSEIAVDECLAGDCPETVHVVRRGGERDGVGLSVDGEATPALGSEVVVYLRRDVHGRLRVLGGVQGLLHVVTTAQGRFAVRDLSGHQVMVDGAWQTGGFEAVALPALARSLARASARSVTIKK